MSIEVQGKPSLDFSEELPTGTKLLSDQFEITSYLNHGGFGITYLANNSLNRQVVIKECYPGSFCRRSEMAVKPRSRAHVSELQNVVRLFMNEAIALSKLDHPNIVGVHQVFEDNNTAYMVLDYVKGDDMLSCIGSPAKRLNPTQVQSILEKLLGAVGAVHDAGLLHRDISPDNVILTEDLEPILIDFGAARQQATNTTKALSALQVVKDGYSPQEFYLAGSTQSPSSDLYSLAATFYHTITGETPPDSQVRLTAHVSNEGDPYVPLAKKTDQYNAQFCAAIDKAMSILPRDRMQSASEWTRMLTAEPAPEPVKKVSRIPSRRVSKQAPQINSMHRAKGSSQRKAFNAPVVLLGSAAIGVIVMGLLFAPQTQDDIAQSPSAPVADQTTTLAIADVTPAPAIVAPTNVQTPVVEVSGVAAPAVVQDPVMAQSAPALGVAPADLSPNWADGQLALSWTADVPFVLDEAGTLIDADASAVSVPIGSRLAAVNGQPVTGLIEANAAIRAQVGTSNTPTASLDLTWVGIVGESEFTTQVNADIVYQTSLQNGVLFTTSFVEGDWVTVVMQTSSSEGIKLRVGDEIVALVPENTRLTSGASLAEMADEAWSQGRQNIQLAVRRDDTLWIADINLAAEAG